MTTPVRYLRLAGVNVPYSPRYPDTFRYFGSYSDPAPAPGLPRTLPVRLSDEDWRQALSEGMEPSAYSEYSLLTFPVSDALMALDRIVVHAVALRRREQAWLICAESGVGKSTQAHWLQQLRPKEFGVISGDRPILEFCHSERSEESASPVPSLPLEGKVSPVRTLVTDEVAERQAADSTNSSPETPPHPSSGFRETPESTFPSRGRQNEGPILVHPSPWNGKENWYGAEAAPLAGIILLRRGEENRLCALSPREAAIPFYTKLLQSAWDETLLVRAAGFATAALERVPIWQLSTHRVPDSTELLLESVFCG